MPAELPELLGGGFYIDVSLGVRVAAGVAHPNVIAFVREDVRCNDREREFLNDAML